MAPFLLFIKKIATAFNSNRPNDRFGFKAVAFLLKRVLAIFCKRQQIICKERMCVFLFFFVKRSKWLGVNVIAVLRKTFVA